MRMSLRVGAINHWFWLVSTLSWACTHTAHCILYTAHLSISPHALYIQHDQDTTLNQDTPANPCAQVLTEVATRSWIDEWSGTLVHKCRNGEVGEVKVQEAQAKKTKVIEQHTSSRPLVLEAYMCHPACQRVLG
jgi:hypothetical protein